MEQLTGVTEDQARAEAETAQQTEALSGAINDVMTEVQSLSEAYEEAYTAAFDSVNGQYALWDEAGETVPTKIGSINKALELYLFLI